MLSFKDMKHNELSEKIVQVLCDKTQNHNPKFFRILVGYYFSVVASMMRAKIQTHDRGDIPVNLYAINLSASGTGKGYSTNILENQVIHKFRERFLDNVFPLQAETNFPSIAVKRSARKGTDPDEELEKVRKEFDALGPLVFSFDSATVPAVKQMRHKLIMANAGAMSLAIDEIGSNLLSSTEVLTTFLELYDVGQVKQKLTKNTKESIRMEELYGFTPTNMNLFGTPSKLLNGGKTEEEFYAMLETGYARRCFFGFSKPLDRKEELTPEELYERLTKSDSNQTLEDIADHLEMLADVAYMNRELPMSKDVALLLIKYKMHCERVADSLPEHEELRRAELNHRYFKALKLAGAYAFVEDALEIEESHLNAAIKVTEESGESFIELLTRERNYVRLARYICDVGKPVTQADLTEDLPFYKGSQSQKNDMMTLATAYGYQNHMIIKKNLVDGIEFISGESIKETDLKKMILSWSNHFAENYTPETAPFDQLHILTQKNGLNWASHHFNDNHREENKAIPGFNMVVLDVDEGTSLETAKSLLKDYTYHIYTTKRHTDEANRFRVILPTNYILKLDSHEYREFMKNIASWLPFEIDTQTYQRNRKWSSWNGTYFTNEGKLLDVLPFIPKTNKNKEFLDNSATLKSMDHLERWVIRTTEDGNRNNQLFRYAMILLDNGMNLDEIRRKVLDLNSKLTEPLDQSEIDSTLIVSVARAIAKRSGA